MLAEFRLYWLEAPLPFYPMAAYAELCAQSPIQISCESAGGFWESQAPSAAASFMSSCPMSRMSAASASGSAFRRWRGAEGACCVPHCFSTGILPRRRCTSSPTSPSWS